MNDKGMINLFFTSSLVNLLNFENTLHFKKIKDQISISMNDFLIITSIPVTQDSNFVTFRDSIKSFELDGDILKAMTNYHFNVAPSKPQERKLMYEFGKEMKFNIKQVGRKSPRDRSLKKLLKSAAIMALGISTKLLPENPNELCDRLKLLLQKNKPEMIQT